MKAAQITALCSALVSAAVMATGAPALATVSLTVQPLVAEFNAPSGSNGRTTVTVTNTGTGAERIKISHTDWRTLVDGSMTLERVGAERGHSITKQLSLSSYQFTLQPGERRDLTLALAVPASFTESKSYWGGFLINANEIAAPVSSVGVAATVFVYENVGSPRKHLQIQSMRVSPNAGVPDLVVRLHNDSLGYCRPSAHVRVEQAGRVVRNQDLKVSTVFPGATRILTQSLGPLPAGDYRVEITLDYGGDSIVDGVTVAHLH